MKTKYVNFLFISIGVFLSWKCTVHAYLLPKQFDEKTEILKNYDKTNLAIKVKDTLVDENQEYPAFFGGIYISDDSNHLIIQVVKDKVPTKNNPQYARYQKSVTMDESIQVRYVNYSYTDLMAVYEQLVNEMKNSNKNIKGVLIDTIQNKVMVELLDNSLAKQEEIKKIVMNQGVLEFVDFQGGIFKENKGAEKENSTLASTLNPGQELFFEEGTCSLGFGIRTGGQTGFLTSAHCVSGLDSMTLYGNVKKYMFHHSVDAAFIETNSMYVVSNLLKYGPVNPYWLNSSNNYATSVVGTKIGKSGYASQYTSGVVKSLDYTLETGVDNVVLDNLIATDMMATNGDSGGVVFSLDNSVVAGLVEGYSPYGSCFVNAKNIYTSFSGYSRY